MAYTLGNKCAKNLCKRIVLLQLIIENVVTCFFGTQCIRDIWTKFGTEHKYHTTNKPEWLNSHKLKIQDGGGRRLEYRKNVNNFGLDKDILHQIIWEDAPWPCWYDHVTKSQNRNSIRVTSSNEVLKYMCVDLGNYNRYLNEIWYRTQLPLYQHAGMAKFT